MVALTASLPRNLPFAPLAALIVGAAAALAAGLFPTWRLEGLMLDTGIAALFPPAQPPLGATARLLIVLAAGGIAGGATLFVARRVLTPAPRARTLQRRADLHPDAPLREPVMAARDLGTPFLEVVAPRELEAEVSADSAPVERPLPANLEVPMVAFARGAIEPDVDVEPEPVASEARIETFELTPPVRPLPLPIRAELREPEPAIVAAETDATIHLLLDRLERGMARRRTTPAMTERPDAEGLEDALVTLRRFATR
ncbi:hypothetical protein [Sphingomonas baiyangensis]|uniref:Uncharacterized protein n=1 Tax=Sphingomonas baiyangensis TaxID=2572576 RepID=A0A4U1L4B6_9SPHN|nr:hypothetical protein [Sphingomonas baiyangensis]TKD51749.1 hypothetical protein FBR43_14050 [Sphingomonas baiyangensis]